jgi:NAD-reducing hydrogenase small subunit
VARVKIATAWLDACAGCHMSFLDMDEAIVDLAGVIELTATPITDIKDFPRVDVGIIEGCIGNEHDEKVARELRGCCKILMVFGDCACFGGIVGMRNLFSTEEILQRCYHTESTVGGKIPSSEELPRLTRVRSIGEVVKVDCYVPGCPPSAKVIHYALAELLEGRIPVIPSEMMRFD